MALIIKADMPTRCRECRDMGFDIPNCPLHKHTQGNWYRIGKHPDCPIIGEIPNEHGRLVDADELKKDALCCGSKFQNAFIRRITVAPTVVEASK